MPTVLSESRFFHEVSVAWWVPPNIYMDRCSTWRHAVQLLLTADVTKLIILVLFTIKEYTGICILHNILFQSMWKWAMPQWFIAPCDMHYTDVIMSSMASQVTSLTIVYSTVHSGADQRKHQSSASLAFVRGIHRSPMNSPHKRPVTCFHLMTSSWYCNGYCFWEHTSRPVLPCVVGCSSNKYSQTSITRTFPANTHKMHPITRLEGRSMERHLWVHSLIFFTQCVIPQYDWPW